MSDTITPKTQEEWLEHFKQLARKHAESLSEPFAKFFADKIILTREDVIEIIEGGSECQWFIQYRPQHCQVEQQSEEWGFCPLCKRLTGFVRDWDYD